MTKDSARYSIAPMSDFNQYVNKLVRELRGKRIPYAEALVKGAHPDIVAVKEAVGFVKGIDAAIEIAETIKTAWLKGKDNDDEESED